MNDLRSPVGAQLDLIWIETRIEHWLRFGSPETSVRIDRHRRRVGFATGDVFALMRWLASDTGAVTVSIDIIHVVLSHRRIVLPWVSGTATGLLRQTGYAPVRAVLDTISRIERQGLDPRAACPDYWRELDARLRANRPAPPYGRARHEAWLWRRAAS
ncbi:DUF2840 domain-containing protein [Nguyenibacter vanlangensis]|uniref:DUF2840 domain-containing protein n=1 Tax=Nguyenibacter vanlangensis TaxID=1216886 RepID=A0A7Y7ITU9_9PROT|nr:DUF2840 domain-containing protein [Nguyenibacter vanlangensis]NVN10062.1 DUF2840 domain-containing protein [Nguyenibacter vanlangensis]